MQPQDKINILVVDDSPQWWASIEARSKHSSDSFVEINTSPNFESGLARLNENNKFDYVVVDLNLDKNRDAFQFIEEARKQGHFLPYAITSATVKTSALKSKETIDRYVQSQVADYIEKKEIRRLSIFQERIRSSLNDFLSSLQTILQAQISEQLEREESLFHLNQEILSLSKLLATYSKTVKSKSFARLCSRIQSQAIRATIITERSMLSKLALSNHHNASKLSRKSKGLEKNERLLFEDLVGFEQQRPALRSIKALHRLCNSKTPPSPKALQNAINALQRPSTKLGLSDSETLMVHAAEILAEKHNVEVGIEALYTLSRVYLRNGHTQRVALTDLLISNLLLQHDRPMQAIPYLQSAISYAQTSSDPKLNSAIEVALFLQRKQLSASATDRR